ncbi:DUF1467 domain-containing protein [Natronorubrum thiooxidans]|uniref:Uncharacterized protein n=1 Tax=Natronorubrum thiooxidans TaxID=308853 RepID=A0A1N7F979_9EURY|nr:DUF1467 domain-containing protein [Natronorubrum thiooxidans]SIR96812.1 hypothetical protein SAMN05421752_10693 [Natronorubrum thiooxidans]
MTRPFSSSTVPRLVGSVAVVAVGVAVNTGLESPSRLLLGLVLIALGIAGVASAARNYSVDRLRLATQRWWTIALGSFLPYALATAPASDSAAAVGSAFAGPTVSLALESVAAAVVCCAVALTVLYGFAHYGIHPGRRSPEERILADGDGHDE